MTIFVVLVVSEGVETSEVGGTDGLVVGRTDGWVVGGTVGLVVGTTTVGELMILVMYEVVEVVTGLGIVSFGVQ